MTETKLEWALEALRISPARRLCQCENPSVEIHMAQVCYLKCMKCGGAHSRALTLAQVKMYQNDVICT